MILVVDANILFAALIKSGTVRSILLLSGRDFYLPEFSVQEFKKHLPILQKKTGLLKEKLESLLGELLESSGIRLIPFEDFKDKRKIAEMISPDAGDTAYIALALHLNCPIWSNDKTLKKQNKVRIITTKELLEEIAGKGNSE